MMDDEKREIIPPRYGYYEIRRQAQNSSEGNLRREKKEPSTGFGRKVLRTAILALVFGACAGTAFRLTSQVKDGNTVVSKETETETSTAVETTEAVPSQEKTEDQNIESSAQETSVESKGSVAQVAQASMPSVVAITTVSIQEIQAWFGGTYQYKSAGSGSGILVGENDDELLIATNNHVVSGATTLSVFFYGSDVTSASDSSEAVSGIIKGTDETVDLAVVAVKKADIPEEIMQKIKIARLGDSNGLVVGEQVVAIGNALGYGQSVTSGWVSALNRSVVSENSSVSDLIQTDAAINPGNSGGALLNMSGEVIGINSAKYADQAVEGMGYAIPISKALPILEDLMTRVTREKRADGEAGFLGVTVTDVSSQMQWMYDMPSGAFVTDVIAGSPAEQYGLKQKDIVRKLDGQAVSSSSDLIDKLKYYAPGEQVDLVISRSRSGFYQEMTLTVTLGSTQQ